MTNPTREEVNFLLEGIGEGLSDEFEALMDLYGTDSEKLDDPQETAHLNPEDKAEFDQYLAAWRRDSKTFDWLVKFLQSEMDETGEFDKTADELEAEGKDPGLRPGLPVEHNWRDHSTMAHHHNPDYPETPIWDREDDAPAGAGDDVEAYRG